MLIRIYPAAYWDLLQIRRNQTLYVEESTSVKISRDILEVCYTLASNVPQDTLIHTFSLFSERLYIPTFHPVTLPIW